MGVGIGESDKERERGEESVVVMSWEEQGASQIRLIR